MSFETFCLSVFGLATLTFVFLLKVFGEKLVSFMVKNQQQMFIVPAHLKEDFRRHMSYAQKGMCPPLPSTVCHQMSITEYRNQTTLTTSLSLNELMTFITDNLQMSLREKEERLKLFQKHHNDIFLQQFPSGQLWIFYWSMKNWQKVKVKLSRPDLWCRKLWWDGRNNN